MAYAIVQGPLYFQDETGGTATTLSTGTLGVGVTAGNCLIAQVEYVSGSQRTIALARTGDTWVSAGAQEYNGTDSLGKEWFTCANATAGTAALVATFGAAASYRSITLFEVSGLVTSSVVGGVISATRQAGPGTGTDAISSGNVTPSGQPAMLLGAIEDWTGNSTPAAGTGFTSLTAGLDYGGSVNALRPMHKRLTSTSGVAVTGTTTNGSDVFYTGALVLLEAAGGGGGTTSPIMHYARRRR